MKSVSYTTVILKFNSKGEKTGWTYIEVPADVAQKLKPATKKSFRVKGKLDDYSFEKTAIIPMGEGAFILPLNAAVRKKIGKKQGAMLHVTLQEDKAEILHDTDLIMCLEEEPQAIQFFRQMPKSYQNYFSKWVASAKTEPTKAKRIAQTVTAMLKHQDFGQMIRSLKTNQWK